MVRIGATFQVTVLTLPVLGAAENELYFKPSCFHYHRSRPVACKLVTETGEVSNFMHVFYMRLARDHIHNISQ